MLIGSGSRPLTCSNPCFETDSAPREVTARPHLSSVLDALPAGRGAYTYTMFGWFPFFLNDIRRRLFFASMRSNSGEGFIRGTGYEYARARVRAVRRWPAARGRPAAAAIGRFNSYEYDIAARAGCDGGDRRHGAWG